MRGTSNMWFNFSATWRKTLGNSPKIADSEYRVWFEWVKLFKELRESVGNDPRKGAFVFSCKDANVDRQWLGGSMLASWNHCGLALFVYGPNSPRRAGSYIVQDFLTTKEIPTLSRPLYSPVIDPCDFLFPKMKQARELSWQHTGVNHCGESERDYCELCLKLDSRNLIASPRISECVNCKGELIKYAEKE